MKAVITLGYSVIVHSFFLFVRRRRKVAALAAKRASEQERRRFLESERRTREATLAPYTDKVNISNCLGIDPGKACRGQLIGSHPYFYGFSVDVVLCCIWFRKVLCFRAVQRGFVFYAVRGVLSLLVAPKISEVLRLVSVFLSV